MAVNSNYEGVYRLTHLYDSATGEVALPAEKEFKLRLQHGSDAHTYSLGIIIGNSLGGSVTITDSTEEGRDAFSAGPMRSTMMMPPENLWTIEKALKHVLPAAEFIHLEGGDNEDQLLIVEGPSGSMRCTRLE